MSGRHFLQIPGPTNVPDRVLRAIAQPTIDHRGPAFADLAREVLDGVREIFKTTGAVVIYPSSGTGAWEAALVNTLSPGDRVLMFETGHFATLWRKMADSFGLVVDFVPGDWRIQSPMIGTIGACTASIRERTPESRFMNTVLNHKGHQGYKARDRVLRAGCRVLGAPRVLGAEC